MVLHSPSFEHTSGADFPTHRAPSAIEALKHGAAFGSFTGALVSVYWMTSRGEFNFDVLMLFMALFAVLAIMLELMAVLRRT